MNILFNMPSYLFCLVFILMLSLVRTAQNFEEVTKCPESASAWKTESGRKNCQGDTPDYMCAAIENRVGKFGEICTKHGLTPAKKCAVLNAQTYNLDSVDCKAASGCPTESYLPSVLWKYPICYDDFYEKITTLALGTTSTITYADSRTEDGGSGSGVVVAGVIVLIIVVVFVVLVVFYVRNQFGFKDKVQKCITDRRNDFQCKGEADENQTADVENGEAQSQADPLLCPRESPIYAQPVKNKSKRGKHDETEQNIKKLTELLKYLVHILKQELGVNDLKEKTVIHSKSIKEHLNEPLIKELQNVEDINDYSRLDTSLVFALLRNFCVDIKAPRRGWNYEPPDDEKTVGADIERIRCMWNKYCDNDLQFEPLDDVYNRMKQKYGTEAVHGCGGSKESPHKEEDGFEVMKDKIESITLNPDCTVEKDIVITESITSALKILNSRNVVVLKGVIGCGKTHALKAIQNHFQSNMETKWVDAQTIEREISQDKPTVLLFDNLFGRFGNSVFSQDEVDKTENVLKAVDGNIKVVIGIHTHVYDEVKKNLKLNFLSQKNITVEMDKLTDAETLLIFKEQYKMGHCKADSKCWFRSVGFQSVLNRLSKNQGHIGSPFLSLMYCNQHELFSNEAFSVNPVQTLVQHLQRMRQDSPSLYCCLLYLMCVQQHNCEEEQKEWARLFSDLTDITKEPLEKIVATSGFVHVEEGGKRTITLAHEILSIALFKSAFEEPKVLFPAAKKCAGDIIIQLLRPANSIHSDIFCAFMDVKNNPPFRNSGKAFVRGLALKYQDPNMNHPLITVDFVKEKYKKYLLRDPEYFPEST